MDYRFDDTNTRLILALIKKYYPLPVDTASLLERFVPRFMSKSTLFTQLTLLIDKHCIMKPAKGIYLYHQSLDKVYTESLLALHCSSLVSI